MTEDPFQHIISSLDYPMFVVTVSDGSAPSGCLVGFSTQCSIEPRRLLVCISKLNHTYAAVRRSQALAVHPLRADQDALAHLFGEQTGDDVDKFAEIAWRPGPEGVPLLAGCNWIAGRILERFDVGDHEGQLVHVVAAGIEHPGGTQLGFQRVTELRPGHEA